MRRIVRGVVSPRLRLAVYHLREAIAQAREVALAPNDDGPAHLRFRPRRFARSLIDLARAHLGRAPTIITPLAPEALPTGARPRIVHLIDGLSLGGSEKLLCDIVRGLGQRWDMEIVTSGARANVRFVNFPIHVARDRAALERVLRSRRPALVHLHYWGLSAWVRSSIEALQSCWPGVGVIENSNNPIQAWHHPAICHYVFVSQHARDIQKTIAPASSSIIYPGVDTEEYHPAGPADSETIGLVYRLENDKLARDAIDILIAVARRRPRARILIVGAGTNFDLYVQRTRAAGVRAQFHFTGFVPYTELPQVYDRMTLFCAPVRNESYGVVVPYAMAKNIPVCGFRAGALPEILGDDALLVDTADELVELVDRLLDDRIALARAGAGGRQRVLERFSLDAMLVAYAELYTRHIDDDLQR